MKIHHLISLFLLGLGTTSAQVSLFERAPGQAAGVLRLGSSDPRPSALQGLTLLPLETTGRTRLTELLEGQARRVADVPGAARLLLPGERGSLYKFRRLAADSPMAYGYFLVGPNGNAESVFEMPGCGPSGTEDPLPGRVAVARDGTSILVATSASAGGDLIEIHLASGTSVNRTPDIGPQVFGRNGFILLPSWGCAVSEQGVYRFERIPDASAVAVPLPFPAPWLGPDVVASADGSTVAFLAGTEVSRALVLTCRSTGETVQASDRPMHIPGAGFLPDDPSGPTLALSTDGSVVAWRAEGSSRECFLQETRATGRPADVHLTGPAHFDNTLNDTGVISFFEPRVVTLAVGRRESGGIGRADLFRIALGSAGSLDATNLSQTSGITRPPYDYGRLDTRDGLYQVPGTASAFLLHDDSGSGRILWVEAGGEVREVLSDVDSLDSLEVAGSYLVASVTRPPGVDDPVRRTLSLVQIPPGGLGAITVALPNGCRLTRGVGSRTHERYAAILEFPAGERLGQVIIPSASGLGLGDGFHPYGPMTGMASDGSILATVQLGPDRATFAWKGLGALPLRMTRVESFLLPGL